MKEVDHFKYVEFETAYSRMTMTQYPEPIKSLWNKN
jgi:hypothetical protein